MTNTVLGASHQKHSNQIENPYGYSEKYSSSSTAPYYEGVYEAEKVGEEVRIIEVPANNPYSFPRKVVLYGRHHEQENFYLKEIVYVKRVTLGEIRD